MLLPPGLLLVAIMTGRQPTTIKHVCLFYANKHCIRCVCEQWELFVKRNHTYRALLIMMLMVVTRCMFHVCVYTCAYVCVCVCVIVLQFYHVYVYVPVHFSSSKPARTYRINDISPTSANASVLNHWTSDSLDFVVLFQRCRPIKCRRFTHYD